jgi:hypothetical protein
VDGGFQAWSAAGLRTKVEGIDSPITILKEDTEELVDEVKPTPDGIFLACVVCEREVFQFLFTCLLKINNFVTITKFGCLLQRPENVLMDSIVNLCRA